MKIELIPLDAQLFRVFMQYRDKFEILHREGIMDLKSGHATLHFDSSGALRRVEVMRTVADTKF